MAQTIRWVIGVAVTQSLLILLLAWLLPGFELYGTGSAVFSAVAISLALAIAWPIIYAVSAKFHPILFPVFTFLLTGSIVYVVGQRSEETLSIDGIWTGILVSLGLTIGNVFIGALFSLEHTAGYHWFVVRPLKRTFSDTARSAVPGVLFLEIDGLSEPVLNRAIDEGRMPTLKRWLDDGSHVLMPWEPDLSSQTSASQAGILLGDNTDIPAFRWYDKPAGKLMVTSKLDTASEVERRLSTGQGLLAGNGASRWNLFSGDAPDCLCTFSAVHDKKSIKSRGYVAYFTNPYTFARTLALMVGDVIRERFEARKQVRRDVRPRIERRLTYAFVRAATTTIMQEASLFMLISDMFRGVPVVYNTFFAYDEVAHHSGIDRPDALKVLNTLDRVFATLERAAQMAPRPYHFVVLSDHGQSMGATFKQRYGETLSDVVSGLISPEHKVLSAESVVEDWGNVNLALTEAARQDGRTAQQIQRALRGYTSAEGVDVAAVDASNQPLESRAVEDANVVVLASGNLGLISFPDWKERMTYAQILESFPDLIGGLVSHEGVGFVMVHSETDGGMVIGTDGIHYLDDDRVIGTDPLTKFGSNAARHLRRTDCFSNAPDILVISQFDPATGEVAAFEELVGSHGGLGGPQTQPFVLFPTVFTRPGEPIVGAGSLHQVFKNWLQPITTATTVEPPPQRAERVESDLSSASID